MVPQNFQERSQSTLTRSIACHCSRSESHKHHQLIHDLFARQAICRWTSQGKISHLLIWRRWAISVKFHLKCRCHSEPNRPCPMVEARFTAKMVAFRTLGSLPERLFISLDQVAIRINLHLLLPLHPIKALHIPRSLRRSMTMDRRHTRLSTQCHRTLRSDCSIRRV